MNQIEIRMVLAKIVHASVFLGGMTTSAITENALYFHNNNKGDEYYDNRTMALYTARVFADAAAIAGAVFLIYDIESERKKKVEERKRDAREILQGHF